MPLEYIVDMTSFTVDRCKHFFLVVGHRPMAAMVADATASCSTFISMAQFSKKKWAMEVGSFTRLG
jgi:hypothetical protein